MFKFLYAWLLPPGIFVLLCLGIAWHGRMNRKLSRAILLLGFLIWLFSASVFSNYLIGSLESQYSIPKRIDADVIVLLGGGSFAGNKDIDGMDTLGGQSANRAWTAIRLAKQYQLPLVYSGGIVYPGASNEAELVKRYALSMGIAPTRFYIEGKSLNTTQSGRFLRPIMQENGWKRPAIVTSAYHMPRSVKIFRKEAIAGQPWPCDYRRDVGRPVGYIDFIPSASALETTTIAIREYLGLISLLTPYANW